jgi:hypothetical protein
VRGAGEAGRFGQARALGEHHAKRGDERIAAGGSVDRFDCSHSPVPRVDACRYDSDWLALRRTTASAAQ